MSETTSTSSENTIIGTKSFKVCASSRNVGMGFRCGESLRSGFENVIIGALSTTKTETSSENVIIGTRSGQSLEDGSCNVIIGHGASPEGTVSDSVALGAFAKATRNGEFVLGSRLHPITTTKRQPTSDTPHTYLQITLNGTDCLIPVYIP